MQYHDVITNPRWRTDAIFKIVFWLYLGVIFADQHEIWNRDEGSHADVFPVTKTAIFANSRWWMAAILKIALSPYQPWIIRFRWNLVHRYKFPFRAWKFDKKNLNFSNSRWRTDAILKTVFGYISVPYFPIYSNFGIEMKNHMHIWDSWLKWQFFGKFKMAYGRHIENRFLAISRLLIGQSTRNNDFQYGVRPPSWI